MMSDYYDADEILGAHWTPSHSGSVQAGKIGDTSGRFNRRMYGTRLNVAGIDARKAQNARMRRFFLEARTDAVYVPAEPELPQLDRWGAAEIIAAEQDGWELVKGEYMAMLARQNHEVKLSRWLEEVSRRQSAPVESAGPIIQPVAKSAPTKKSVKRKKRAKSLFTPEQREARKVAYALCGWEEFYELEGNRAYLNYRPTGNPSPLLAILLAAL